MEPKLALMNQTRLFRVPAYLSFRLPETVSDPYMRPWPSALKAKLPPSGSSKGVWEEQTCPAENNRDIESMLQRLLCTFYLSVQ